MNSRATNPLNRRQLSQLLLAGATAPMALSAAVVRAAPAAAQALDHVIIPVGQDVATLDPHNEPTTNFSHLRSTFENLTFIDNNRQLQPALAESWSLVNDTTWEFKLRPDVKFHNGDTMTADDIVWNFNRVMTEAHPSGPRKIFVAWYESIEKVDDLTVHIHTLGPYPPAALNSTIAMIIPQKYFEEVGPEGFDQNPVGTGPYRITSWALNQQLMLEKFDDYWGTPGTIPTAEFRIIPEESTRISELITGGAHFVLNLSPNRVAELENQPNVEIVSTQSSLIFWLGFNTATAPLDDVRVRQAVAHAIDVPLIIQEVLGGYGTHANSSVHATSIGWDPDLPPFEYNPDLSRQLLAEAGYPDGFSMPFMGGPTVWPSTEESGVAISGFLAEVGIDAPFQLIEWGEYFDQFRNGELEGMFLWGNLSGVDPQVSLNLNYHSPPVGQQIYYNNTELDAMIDRAQTDLDEESRLATIKEIQAFMKEEVAIVPLWLYDEVAAISNLIEWRPRGDFFLQVNEVTPAAE
jgi:peptide/nickel transport system substrate-binding protein